MTEVPPSRWRVVEKGRRLVVIDTLTGEAATRSISGLDMIERMSGSRRDGAKRPPSTSDGSVQSDRLAHLIGVILAGGATTDVGHPIIRTKLFYDNNAPRDLVLDPPAQKRISYAVAALILFVGLTLVAVFAEPAVIVVGFPLASGAVQGWLRGRVTSWLDEIEARS